MPDSQPATIQDLEALPKHAALQAPPPRSFLWVQTLPGAWQRTGLAGLYTTERVLQDFPLSRLFPAPAPPAPPPENPEYAQKLEEDVRMWQINVEIAAQVLDDARINYGRALAAASQEYQGDPDHAND